MRFYAQQKTIYTPGSLLLEFSGGPTIYSLITASYGVSEIHFSDFLYVNRQEVRRWKQNSSDAFDWSHFVRRALEHEGYNDITPALVQERMSLLRSKMTKIVNCNAFLPFPLTHTQGRRYDIVHVNFVPESITHERAKWELTFRHIAALVRPGGYFISTSLKNAHYYLVHGAKFPALCIDEQDMIEILCRNDFNLSDMVMTVIDVCSYRGYEGMMFIRVRKNFS